MTEPEFLPLDQIIHGDCIEILTSLPEQSVDLVFADPPYNLQLNGELYRPNMTRVNGVQDAWDQFRSFKDYDEFTCRWLSSCKRVLKETGALWVIGTYHNIYRVGSIMQDLGYWFLNDIAWIKVNPMPNFRGVRFTNAHETLIWACKNKGAKYTFNHHAMKSINDDLQMRSDWLIPLCTGPERIKVNGKKAHPTQKPAALLYRILLASSNPGDIILDPFIGSGTTGAVAKAMHRHWIGIEQDFNYVQIARDRIENVTVESFNEPVFESRDKRNEPRIPFGSLLENGLLIPGQLLYFRGDRNQMATIKPDGNLLMDGFVGSIHQSARHLLELDSCNGWRQWYYEAENGEIKPIDELRQFVRRQLIKHLP